MKLYFLWVFFVVPAGVYPAAIGQPAVAPTNNQSKQVVSQEQLRELEKNAVLQLEGNMPLSLLNKLGEKVMQDDNKSYMEHYGPGGSILVKTPKGSKSACAWAQIQDVWVEFRTRNGAFLGLNITTDRGAVIVNSIKQQLGGVPVILPLRLKVQKYGPYLQWLYPDRYKNGN